MKRKINACSRAWESEAARDGRLNGEALLDHREHLQHCGGCRQETNALNQLGDALRDLPEPEQDAAAVRRLRQTILAQADADVTGRSGSGPSHAFPRWLIPSVCVVALALALGLGIGKRLVSRSLPEVDVFNEGNAKWTQAIEGDLERVDLYEGTLRLGVHHPPGSRRLVVRVPDGEIEDIGTVFHVSVHQGHTQRVDVDEGRVTIRLTNEDPIALSAGQKWARDERSTNDSAVAPKASPAAGIVQPVVSGAAVRSSSAPLTKIQTTPSARATEVTQGKEDAAYLHVIQLLRDGRNADAKGAAREYLRSFPDGFRREEMERLVAE